MKFLYRGVAARFHNESEGRIRPKKVGPFEYTFHWGEPKWGDFTWGSSESNAVIRHQLGQEGSPTTGISATTPHFERAKLYARGRDGRSPGYVYKIDRSQLTNHGVREFVVSDYVKEPSIPEDDEVILVTSNSGALPEVLVVELIAVEAPDDE